MELIRQAATDLPCDVESALRDLRAKSGGVAREVLDTILENISIAREKSLPICQDTGTPVFYVRHPQKVSQQDLRQNILSAVARATVEVPLRANAVDAVCGKNSGDNIGPGMPVILFQESDENKVAVDLMLKGGGSENATFLYKLPDRTLSAGRDLAGVEKCVLDAVYRTQGKACSPNIIGVGIGGLSGTSISFSQKQFFRRIDDVNPDENLARLEKSLLEKANSLGIGPMGLGGGPSVLAVKAGKLARHPASFFVAVSFMCWASRVKTLEVEV